MRTFYVPSLSDLLSIAEREKIDVFMIVNANLKAYGKTYIYTENGYTFFVASKNFDFDVEPLDPSNPIEFTLYHKN